MKGCATFDPNFTPLPRRKLPENYRQLGRKLRKLRDEADISMGELARFLECKVSRLSDLETGTEADSK